MPGALRAGSGEPVAADDADDGGADDAALVARARADRRQFAALYRRYADPVYRFCYRRLGSHEAAEDATSQVFTRALVAFPRFRDGSFRAWLFTIAHHAVADHHRAERPTTPLAAASDRADAAASPEEVACAAETGRVIRDLLARLPPDQRRTLEPRLAGLSDAEIAHVLGRSHGAVRTSQYRALLRLRAMLGFDGHAVEARDGNG